MNILILTSSYESVGPFRQILKLKDGLVSIGYSVDIVALYGRSIEYEGIDYKSFSTKGFYDLKNYSNFKDYIKLNKIDLLISRMISANFWGAIFFSRKLVRYHFINITYQYSKQFSYNHGVVLGSLLKFIMSKSLNSCNSIIVNSNHLKNDLIGNYNVKRTVKLLNNSIDQKELIGEKKLKKPTIIASVSRLTVSKRIMDIIKMFEVLCQEYVDIELWILGDGEESSLISNYVEKSKWNEKIKLFGNVTDVESYYKNNIDILVSASESEGQPNSLLEAMSYGIPIVCGNYPGHEDVIIDGYNGLQFCLGDTISFSKKVKQLIDDEKIYLSFSKNGLKKIKEDFNIKMNIKILDRVIRKL
jgi:glycosyltransferase involved in cell wall biosynthesis